MNVHPIAGRDGELTARDYESGRPVLVRWSNGTITSVSPVRDHSLCNEWIVPGLVDLQVNGYGGVDFQQDHLTVADLQKAARALRTDGCSRFFPTLITDDWNVMMERLRQMRDWRLASPELRDAIAGWHIEGPFLSPEPGYHGTHNPAHMRDPAPDLIRELRVVSGDDPVLLTMAPERPGAISAIQLAVSLGIRVSLGHTNARADILEAAVQAGATLFTHLGNGCAAEINRHDNILWRVLDIPALHVSLIPDTMHVPPPLFRVLHRALRPDQVFYVTDSMAAAGAPPGLYQLGKLELRVGEDGVVRQPGTPYLSGSALRPAEGVARAARMLNEPWQKSWHRFSVVPAGLMKLDCQLAAGQPITHFCTVAFDDLRSE